MRTTNTQDKTRERLIALTDRFVASAASDAILAEFVVIPRAELPKVVEHGHGNLRVGESNYSSMLRLEKVRTSALECLALAEKIEARDFEQAATEAKRNARRDELAMEFTADTRGTLSGACNYAGLLPWTRKMVDRIIELEEAAA